MEVYIGAFLAGIGATVTPGVLPLYPALLAYLTGGAGDTRVVGSGAEAIPLQRLSPGWAALLVWAGVVAGMLAVGGLVAAIAIPLGQVNRTVLPIADLVLIGLGVLLLGGVNPCPLTAAIVVSVRRSRAAGRRLPLWAPVRTDRDPCSGPFIVGIFAFSLTIGGAVGRLLFFAVFGVGLPLFLLGMIGQVRGAQLARAIVQYERPLQLGLGLVLIVVGIWDLAINAPLILG